MLRVGFFSLVCPAGLIAMLTMASEAQATFLTLGNYSVLYPGMSGQSLSITNGSLGNIDVGGTGNVQFNSPSMIDRRLDFAAVNAGQYQANVTTTDIFTSLTNLSAFLSPAANPVTVAPQGAAPNTSSGNQTVNAPSGAQGVILASNDAMSITNGDLTSRFGGNSYDIQINGTQNGDEDMPEPASIAMFVAGLFGLGLFFGLRWRPVRTNPSPS